ncbi:MAG TPA: UDP-N-acetylmuramoyl-L-alanine--D-glutamate ligase [Sphingomicrobium sp.]
MITAKAFAGKHYAVYGLARSGIATVKALLASGARVTAWDDRLLPGEGRGPGQREPLLSSGLDPGLRRGTEIANLNEIDLSQFESLVVTPGLPLNRHPIAQRARDVGVEIIGDIELFARARPELPPHKVVGITGTNGKSTTTALVHHILKTAGVPTTMGGNIGLPILVQDPLPEGGVYVLELSSYQIDLTQSLDCDVAVLLNITPDHLDRYESFEAYAASKMRLFEMQSFPHIAIITSDVSCNSVFDKGWWTTLHLDRSLAADKQVDGNLGSAVYGGRAYWNSDAPFAQQSDWPTLQGPHNAQNAAAAIEAAVSLGLNEDQISEGLRTYPGLPHRMERVREKDGVIFVNDSKATNPTATAPALAAFDHIRWICGGQAKTDNLDECAPHFGHVRKAYTIGEAGELFASLLSPHMAVAECETLERAVGEAAGDAEPGDTVLLSPACASFDQFRDFEDRGDQFRALVEGL